MLKKQKVLEILSIHKKELDDFAVQSLLLFGSVAKDSVNAESDVDLIVEFNQPVGLFKFIGLKQYLEEILQSPVDLGTINSLKPHVKENILKEAIRVF